MIVTLLPGTSVTYYGEEIGMIDNTDITYEEGVDPWGCNYPPEEFAQRTRDFERTPMQWYPSTNAGKFHSFDNILWLSKKIKYSP